MVALSGFPGNIIDWTVYSATWIACCAGMLSLESCWVNQTAVPDGRILLLIISSVFCQYNVHYWSRETDQARSMRDRWTTANRWWYFPAIVISGMVALSCFITLTHLEMLVVATMGAISILYSLPLLPGRRRLKQYGVLKPLILSGVWVVMTVWLPIHGTDSNLLPWIMARRFVFMLSLCLAFDVRDAAKDSIQKVMTIPVLYGNSVTYWFIAVLLASFVAFAFAVELYLHRPWVLCALVCSALFTYWAIWQAKDRASERFYLLVVDGMMIVQALLVWLAV
jgi:4-hydroxybenzoate polyprenyltransferase